MVCRLNLATENNGKSSQRKSTMKTNQTQKVGQGKAFEASAVSLYEGVGLRPFIVQNPDVFLNRLKNQDDRAWAAVRNEFMLPALRRSKKYNAMAYDRTIPLDDVCDHVYEVMVTGKKKLNAVRKPERVLTVLWDYAKQYLRTFYDKRKEHRVTIQLTDEQWRRLGDMCISGTIKLRKTYTEKPEAESVVALRESVKELWRNNPIRGYVAVLKAKGKASSEIKSFLNLASEGYVDTVYARAKSDLRKGILGKLTKRSNDCKNDNTRR